MSRGLMCTACGCERVMHNYSSPHRCTNWRGGTRANGWQDGHRCRCPGFTVAVLPAEGERLEFGTHHMDARDAEAAPAWPSLAVLEGRRLTSVKRAVAREKARSGGAA